MAIQTRRWLTASGEQREAYIIRYTGTDGKRHIETHERKKDAEAAWARIKTDLGEGTHVAPSQSITVAEAATEWLVTCENKRRLERSTLEQYRAHVRYHVIPFIGTLKLSDLTLARVSGFEDKLLSEGRSPTMCKKVMTSLCSILAEAQGRGKVQRNVMRDRARTRGKGSGKRKRLEVGVDIPAPAEIKAIIAAAKPEWRTLLLVTALTGMRASEVRGLRWCEVDLKANKIRVCQRADQYHGIGAPKSKSGTRTIPLPGPAVQALREWKLKSGNSAGLVFPMSDGRGYSASDHCTPASGGWRCRSRNQREGRAKICGDAQLAAFLCLLVHQSNRRWGLRVAREASARAARSQQHQHDA